MVEAFPARLFGRVKEYAPPRRLRRVYGAQWTMPGRYRDSSIRSVGDYAMTIRILKFLAREPPRHSLSLSLSIGALCRSIGPAAALRPEQSKRAPADQQGGRAWWMECIARRAFYSREFESRASIPELILRDIKTPNDFLSGLSHSGPIVTF